MDAPRHGYRYGTSPAVLLFAAASALGVLAPDEIDDGLAAARAALLESVNAARSERRLSPIALHPELSRVAQTRAAAAANKRPTDPDAAAREDGAAAAGVGYDADHVAEIFVRADGDADSVLQQAREDRGFEEEVFHGGTIDLGIGAANLDSTPTYVFLFGHSRAAAFQETMRRLSDLTSVRRAIFARVNRERAAAHLPPVRENPRLDAASLRHAKDMLGRSYYGHDSPEGSTAFERTRDSGYRTLFAGENIARGPLSADAVMDGWMSSPEHREHILAERFTETGSAVAAGRNRNGDQVLWVQLFGRPKDVSAGDPSRRRPER
jgi:uncharacterized protein YkwD